MKFSVVSVFPEMIEQAAQYGVLGQAIKKNKISLETTSPREFTEDLHKTVDDRPYGGGDGMVMLASTLAASVEKLKQSASSLSNEAAASDSDIKRAKVIYLSPQGEVLTAAKAKELSSETHLILVCGRYGGVDQRFINQYVDEEISIGDYVLSGGELGALVLMDSVSRWVDGVLGHSQSAAADSFSNGLLEAPLFTRPPEFNEQSVPEVLLSGNHKLIETWREKVSLLVTLKKRPELLFGLSEKERKDLKKFWDQLSVADRISLGLEELW